jgi:hypothetical protein
MDGKGKVFINGVEQPPAWTSPSPKILIDGVEIYPPIVDYCNSSDYYLTHPYQNPNTFSGNAVS